MSRVSSKGSLYVTSCRDCVVKTDVRGYGLYCEPMRDVDDSYHESHKVSRYCESKTKPDWCPLPITIKMVDKDIPTTCTQCKHYISKDSTCEHDKSVFKLLHGVPVNLKSYIAINERPDWCMLEDQD